MTKIGFGKKLYVQISVVIAFIAMFISAVASYFVYKTSLQNQRQVNEKLVNQLALSVERTAAIAAYLDDEELATEIINGLALNDLVSAAAINSVQTLRVTSNNINPQSLAVNLTLYNPFIEDDIVGGLKVYPNIAVIQRSANERAIQSVILLLSLSLITAICVSIFIHRLLTRPLRKITAGFEEADVSDIATMNPIKLNYPKQNEIGVLITGINALVKALQKALSEERTLRAKTEILEKRFRLIFEQASAGIAVIQMDETLYAHNDAFSRVMGLTEDYSGNMADLFLQKNDFLKALSHVRDGTDEDQFTADLPFMRNGEVRFAHCLFARIADERATPRDSEDVLVEIIVYDITERLNREKRVRYEADHDALTHLKNRRAGEPQLQYLLETVTRDNMAFVLMMIDLDRFKPINDQFGHDAGDMVLKVVAKRIKHYFDNERDICIRWGGDEFVVGFALPELDKTYIIKMTKNLMADIQQPISINAELRCEIGASIGIVSAPQHGQDLEALLIKADETMYHVKAHGRNQFLFAS